MTSKLLLCGTAIGTALLLGTPASSSAALLSSTVLIGAAEELRIDTEVARRGGGARRAGGARVRTGNVRANRNVNVRSRTVVRNKTVVRPGAGGAGVRWARPANYRWRRGGAIAAGAAIGFVTAATAAAWAGAPPAPDLRWYYTDPTRTQGFWDYCP
jgi:hypothetical protein